MNDTDRDHLVTNIVAHASAGVSDDVQRRVVQYWTNVDPQLGARVAAGLGHGGRRSGRMRSLDSRGAATPRGPLLVRALRGEPVERVPVWFMRQAGRSLPEYRELRRGRTLMELARTPELAAEVTLQPVRRHGVDAAILFSDIVVPLAAIGVDVEIQPGVGPVVAQPVRSAGGRAAAAAAPAPARTCPSSRRRCGCCARSSTCR